jgi:hypothetical protein
MRILGVDPGKYGAVAAVDGDLCAAAWPMPDDPDELAWLLAPYAGQWLALEQQTALPRQGVASAAKLMHRAGVVRGVCAGLGLRVVPVWPVQWRRYAQVPIGANKAAAVALARRVGGFNAAVEGWPAASVSGAADALWIAHAGARLIAAGKA